MIKTLTKHGNSKALIFNRTMTELMKIDEDTKLELRIEGERMIITPIREDNRRAEIARLLERNNRKFGPALKKMAE
ncbi:MAG: AbrB family transcriptional regulator [Phycisphaerae bacterium]|jgi:antitoxin component of MazEF toxin-antitoxin module|nr:AbrB family transcriptional regulator [Phycisphaerae bacterium]MBM91610.1 AbrB family transcriptional regulator [Phycisphaerae bacterium]HCT45248.1 AbrB family transcriptional regulator [Phycisphaerales bacterium]|tara:strand:+ start:1156 stop:1383 length:228 start_codon:yes stop_codon:yes gene_type:complete